MESLGLCPPPKRDMSPGAAAPSPPSPQQPAEAELSEAERADLSELCHLGSSTGDTDTTRSKDANRSSWHRY